MALSIPVIVSATQGPGRSRGFILVIEPSAHYKKVLMDLLGEENEVKAMLEVE